MSTIHISLEEEKQLIINIRAYLLALAIGTNDMDKFKEYYKNFASAVEKVKVLPYGSDGEKINEQRPGCCTLHSNGKSKIEIYGLKNMDIGKIQEVKGTFAHEYCHALCNYLGHLSVPDYKEINDQNGEIYIKTIIGGRIRFTNSKVDIVFGNMFAETFADMFATMALIAHDPNYSSKNATIDMVLKQHIDTWGSNKTGYSIFTSLTRLVIAAFSNVPTINYQSVAKEGKSICTINASTHTGRNIRVNDFLYGMVFNPIEIENKYDFFMGKGAYINLCSRIDYVFEEYFRTQIYTEEIKKEIKHFMTVLSHFCNKKMTYYRLHGIWDLNDTNIAVSNYNKIWNNLQREYRSFFTEQDIEDIEREAAEPSVVYQSDFYPSISKYKKDQINTGHNRI